jgi:hypothetical protein
MMCNVVRISRKQRLAHKEHAFYSMKMNELILIKNCLGKHKTFMILSSCPITINVLSTILTNIIKFKIKKIFHKHLII